MRVLKLANSAPRRSPFVIMTPSAAQWRGRDPCAHGNRRRGSRDPPLQQPMRFSSDLLAGRLGLPAPVRLVQVRMQVSVEVEVQIKVRMGWEGWHGMGRDGMMGLWDYGIMGWKVRPPNGHSPFRTAFNFSLFCQPVSFTAGWPAWTTVIPSYIHILQILQWPRNRAMFGRPLRPLPIMRTEESTLESKAARIMTQKTPHMNEHCLFEHSSHGLASHGMAP